MSRDIIIYPNRNLTGATDQPFISFSGLSAGTISLVVEDDGSITFDGDTGSLFGISDNKDGLLHSVNDVSGLPIFQVYDDERIIMGKWDDPAMTLTSGGTVNINLDNVGGGTPLFNLGVDSSGDVVTGTTGGGGGSFTGNTSGDCITDLYVSNIHGCSPITFHDSINFNGSIVDSGITNSLIFGGSHVYTGGSITHGTTADANVILGGDNNKITPYQVGLYNTIIGGSGNEIGGVSRVSGNAIIGSADSTIGGVFITGGGSTIFGGGSHLITSTMSTIAGGSGHSIINGTQSATIGGVGNLLDGVDRSVVLGGQNITGTTDDTVYVPNLNIGTVGSGTPNFNLGVDSSGNVVTGTTGGGGTDTVSATTTQIDFTAPKIFYKYTNQATGNISEDLTGAKLGITQKIYHNDASEPTYPAGWVLMGDGIYFTSQLNIIYCEWSEGSRVEYWYVQEQ